jgi:hypothetical protein
MVNCGRWGAVLRRGRLSVLCALLVFGGVTLLRHDLSTAPIASSHLKTVSPASLLARLPVAFEPNVGQSAEPVKFLAHGSGYGLFLTRGEAALSLSAAREGNSAPMVRMQFSGANPTTDVSATEKLAGRTNYFIGNDRSRWLRDVPQFGRVRYASLYPGIDLDFYGHEGHIEYDFTVAPGADPHKIQLQFHGADNLQIANNGDLVLAAAGREVRFQAPHVYQKSGSREDPVAGSFVLLANGRAGFEVGPYDRSRALVIDPVLTYSTYLGGSGNESCGIAVNSSQTAPVPHCPAVALDSASRVYLAGATTLSPDFTVSPPNLNGWPTSTALNHSGPLTGSADVFVARVSSTGTALALDYLTFIGGTGSDYPTGLGVDNGFNVYIAGNTGSSDFPTVNGLQSSASGSHGFLSKLDPGANLLYSTYIGGSGSDSVSDLAVDTRGHAYAFGITSSSDLPVTAGALQPTYPAGVTNQFFFAKFDPAQNGTNSLLYLTYFGGTTPTSGAVSGGGIAVDSNLNVYVAGGTTFTDMPVVNAYRSTQSGGVDVWVAKLKAPTTNTQQYSLVYETYFGGTGDDVAYGVAVDGTSAYVTGSTNSITGTASPDIVVPTGTTPFQKCLDDPTNPATCSNPASPAPADAFVAKFGSPVVTGTTQGTVPLNYFSYVGGSGSEAGFGVTVDSTQTARIAGFTNSGNFLNTDALPGVSGGGTDAFLARIATSSGSGSATTILGGSGTDIGTSIVTDVSLNSYIAGDTSSGNFPATSSAGQAQVAPIQSSISGSSDAFLSKLGPNLQGLSLTCPPAINGVAVTACSPGGATANPSPVGVGNKVTFTYPIYNTGDPVVGAIFTVPTVAGAGWQISGASSTSSSAGNCTFTSSTAACNLGTLNTSTVSTSGTTTTLTSTSSVTITVTATAPNPPGSFTISNSGTLSIAGTSFQVTLPQFAQVNDFTIQAAPATQTVTAGNQATYTVTVTPTGVFPNSVSLGPCTGLPAGASCVFAQNPIPNLNSLAQNRTLEITTTPRVTTPASLFGHSNIFYGFWLPISGLAFVGVGVTRKRRWLIGVFVVCTLGAMLLQSGCGSYSSNSNTTTGTPAGTYTVTIGATSGSATRNTTVTLTVQ